MSEQLAIVCAMPSEARPWITALGLQQASGSWAFQVYRRDHLWLVICGVGKLPAAIATTMLLQALRSRGGTVAANIGTAGSRDRELAIGQSCVVNLVHDLGSGNRVDVPAATTTLPIRGVATADGAVLDGGAGLPPDIALVDMEASGFVAAAALLPPDCFTCLKVVSDYLCPPLPGGTEVKALTDAAVPELRQLLANRFSTVI